jgi:hypothetical protein
MPLRCAHSPFVIHGAASAMLPMSRQAPAKVSSMSFLVEGIPAPGSPEKKSTRIPKLRGSIPSRRATSARCSAYDGVP